MTKELTKNAVVIRDLRDYIGADSLEIRLTFGKKSLSETIHLILRKEMKVWKRTKYNNDKI